MMGRRNFLLKLFILFSALFTGCKRLFSMTKEKQLKMVLSPQEQHWVGDGFHVHTLMSPSPDLYPSITPFLLMDYAPPREFPATTEKKGVGEHPHRGFETVTFAIEGEVEHRDSAGGGGVIGTGDVQWMTAASGLVHEEFHSREFAKKGGPFEMVQLWVNLPAKKKMTKPRYQGVKNSKFPRVNPSEATEVQVVAGEYKGKSGPCDTHTPINTYLVNCEKDDQLKFDFKNGTNTLVLVLRGDVTHGDKSLGAKNLLIFEREGEEVSLKAKAGTRLLVLNGEPIDEPIAAYGPFVMNTKEELMQAFQDFQSGKMGRL
jgi:hypothetical protein